MFKCYSSKFLLFTALSRKLIYDKVTKTELMTSRRLKCNLTAHSSRSSNREILFLKKARDTSEIRSAK